MGARQRAERLALVWGSSFPWVSAYLEENFSLVCTWPYLGKLGFPLPHASHQTFPSWGLFLCEMSSPTLLYFCLICTAVLHQPGPLTLQLGWVQLLIFLVVRFSSCGHFSLEHLSVHFHFTRDQNSLCYPPKFCKEQKQKRQSIKLNFSIFSFYHVQYNV